MSDEFGLFQYVGDLTAKKSRLIELDDEFEKNYNPFMVTRALSNNVSDVLWANILNVTPEAFTKRMHYDFLFHTLKAGKRYGKWAKETKSDEIDAVAEYHQINKQEAERIIDLISREEMERILTYKGGKIK